MLSPQSLKKWKARAQWIRQSATACRTDNGVLSVPRSYVDFCAWLGVELSPAQTVVGKVAFDGMDPRDLEGEERDAARVLFGNVETIPEAARSVVVAVCGGRGGKTYTMVALRMLHLALTIDLSPIAPGQRAVALVVAPNEGLRAEAINYALGAAKSKPELARLLVLPQGHKEGSTTSWFGIRRPDFGRIVRFETGVATQGGYGGRGRALVGFAMDECAFFRDAQAKVNDRDIFAAASPRVLPGGQTIVPSTPWAKTGLLYDLYAANREKPHTAIAIHAPTTLLNPSRWARTIVDRERHRDSDNARREFDAEFMGATATNFFDADLVALCMVPAEVFTLKPGDVAKAGGDFGFRTNSSALGIAIARDGAVHVPLVLEVKPEEGKPLRPSYVVKTFAEELVKWGCGYLMADAHYRDSIAEHLVEHDLAFLDAPTVPHEAFVACKQLMRDGKVKIHANEKLGRQLREVRSMANPGGTVSVHQPLWRTGEHGDLVSALVLAVSQLGGTVQQAPKGSQEDQDREARRLASVKAQSRKVGGKWYEK